MTQRAIEIRGLSKPSDDLMTITEPDGTRFLVFDKAIYPHLELGKIIDAEIELDVPKKDKTGTYNLVRSITVEGKIMGGEKRRGFAFSRGRDEDRTDIRSALITIKDLWIADKIKEPNPLITWLLAELLVFATGKKEKKDETTKAQITQAPVPVKQTQADVEVGAEYPIVTIGNLWTWVASHGKEFTRDWARKELAIPAGEVITLAKAKMMYETLRQKMGW